MKSNLSSKMDQKNKKLPQFNRLFIHPSFKKTVNSIKKVHITLPSPSKMKFGFGDYVPNNAKIFSNIEKIAPYSLNPKDGEEYIKAGRNEQS